MYNWLVGIVNEKKENTDLTPSPSLATYASMAKMMMDPSHKEQYINEHLMVDGFYDKR